MLSMPWTFNDIRPACTIFSNLRDDSLLALTGTQMCQAAVAVHKSTSTVGFPRESKISRAFTAMILLSPPPGKHQPAFFIFDAYLCSTATS